MSDDDTEPEYSKHTAEEWRDLADEKFEDGDVTDAIAYLHYAALRDIEDAIVRGDIG